MATPTFIQIPRDPTQDYRTRRALDIIANLLNSLLLKGQITQIAPADFNVASAGGDMEQTVVAQNIFGNNPRYSQQFADATDPIFVANSQPQLAGQIFARRNSGLQFEATVLVDGGITTPDRIITPQGRLTLVSGVPVMVAEETAKSNVYYTPYVGDVIPVYTGTLWIDQTFAELTMALDTTNQLAFHLYDLFVWNNAGTIAIGAGPAWTSSSARGTGAGTTEITQLNGIWVNANSITLTNGAGAGTSGIAANTATYVGTLWTTANGQTTMQFRDPAGAGGTSPGLFLYNAYQRLRLSSRCQDNTASYAYTTTTWRVMNNSTSNRVNYVDGLAQSAPTGTVQILVGGGAANAAIGVNLNATTGAPTQVALTFSGNYSCMVCRETFYPSLGLNVIQAMELGDGTSSTFFGKQNSVQIQQTLLEIDL